jgi:hypothetical protein
VPEQYKHLEIGVFLYQSAPFITLPTFSSIGHEHGRSKTACISATEKDGVTILDPPGMLLLCPFFILR